MGNSVLHITNGDNLTARLESLNLTGDIIVWREMLCEGPTPVEVGSQNIKFHHQIMKRNLKTNLRN